MTASQLKVISAFALNQDTPTRGRLYVAGNALYEGPGILAVKLANQRALVDLTSRLAEDVWDLLEAAGWTVEQAPMLKCQAAAHD